MNDENKKEAFENGTYEVIRNRLEQQGNELKECIEKLNAKRRDVFGAIETKLIGSERIITEYNCVPRDMVPVDACFIFGYNVVMGLKSKVELQDVFSVYGCKDRTFQKLSLDLITDARFQGEFDELYKYYRNTFFTKFTVIEPYLYMVFQTGKTPFDIKAFKWLIEDGRLSYVDSRSEHEVRFENKNGFDWIRATRDDQREGRFPHVSILDTVFVETIGGDLTIKVEDNTSTGKGIYSEKVEDPDQTLDDAEISYARLGQLILLKIRPYREDAYRYFIFNSKLKNLVRVDSIRDNCMVLPGEHGIIFPTGYYLVSGEYKQFDVPLAQPVFDQRLCSVNGEDYQYIFYNMESGVYLIYAYNLIEQSIETPIVCNGYSHFNNGEMVVFRHDADPRKNHMLQIWQTPFVGKNYVYGKKSESLLYKIGNKDIVQCMADCRVICNLIRKGEGYQSIYVDIVRQAEQIIDTYFWLDKEEACGLKGILSKIRETSAFAVEEYEKVLRIRTATKQQIEEVEKTARELFKNIQYKNYETMDEYVRVLSELRALRGKIASLRDLRYTNLPLIEQLESSVREKNDDFSKRCVAFLLKPEGLAPYRTRVDGQMGRIDGITRTLEGNELCAAMDETSADLEMLIELVGNFKMEDPVKTTEIIESISAVFSGLNQARAKLKQKLEKMCAAEMTAQFQSRMKLLNQAVVSYLELSDTAEKCGEYLNKVMVQVQELESKFADFDKFVLELAEKREELYNAFENKKQALVEARNRKVLSRFQAAERILKGISGRLAGFETTDAINGYFATDIMVEKVRDLLDQLQVLGDTVKADELEARLKTAREEALRQLRDKQELYLSKDVIRFGQYLFSVNTKPTDLAMIQQEDALYFHVSGTDFRDRVQDEKAYSYRSVWDMSIPSENDAVYRAEYLAWKLFNAARRGEIESLEVLASAQEPQLLSIIRKFMEPRYQESYTKGVHDADCLKILKSLLDLHRSIDLLRYSAGVRALAQLFWNICDTGTKEMLNLRLKELARVSRVFDTQPELKNFIPLVTEKMEQYSPELPFYEKRMVPQAAEYLCTELMRRSDFVISLEAQEVYEGFTAQLKHKNAHEEFRQSIKAAAKDRTGLFYLVLEWLQAYCSEGSMKKSKELSGEKPKDAGSGQKAGVTASFDKNPSQADKLSSQTAATAGSNTALTAGNEVLLETAVLFVTDSYSRDRVVNCRTHMELTGLAGSHPVIQEGRYCLSYTAFMDKLQNYETNVVRDFVKFNEIKKELLLKYRQTLQLDHFKPQVLSSFVRNELIDKVYLPLIGANLAKQLGVAGENKRTDLMGMLLLISPPGYGKTTLMEYIASRMGLLMVKINGPALGNRVTSLDPGQADNEGSKEELKRLNLAFKMGNNVMIYIDDIQHCNPEFLQKFISLCDGQRRIEGVYNGAGQVWDLRGKKVAVVMAGNPYTESGEKFKIPDMLSNRADVYNLGDMLHENEEAFKLSYIENAITSNPILNKLSNRSRNDIHALIALAKGAERETLRFEESYSVDELHEYTAILEKLFKVRNIVLRVNQAYIYSAAQADIYRNEPPFKLQGSYRNMNKIAERVVSVMNENELDELILKSYENDAQTLAADAEANLLKWKEIIGVLTQEEQKRWNEIKAVYEKNKLVRGDDKMGQTVMIMDSLNHNLEKIREILAEK